jgi:hypothetical protein
MALRDLPVIRVTLTYDEEVTAHRVGFERATELKSTANHSSRGNKALNYHEYIGELSEAVGGELSVAKFFGIDHFKPTVNTFKSQADINSRIEVKWTKWLDGHLVLRQSDRNHDIAILVVGKSPEYFLVGWTPVKHGKVDRNWVAGMSAWWINQEHLRPMQDFLGSDYATATL